MFDDERLACDEWFFYQLRPECDGDRSAAEDFWTGEIGLKDRPGEWVKGFIEGALDVWDKVKSQI